MIIYITKYALTQGIIKVEAEIKDNMASYTNDNHSLMSHAHGQDWWKNKDDAIARAEEMRIKKLQSIDKQMKKIRALKFN